MPLPPPSRPSPRQRRSEALDLAALVAQTGNDPALQKDLLELFVVQSPPILARLREVVARDIVAAKEGAHRLKGSARAIGAFGVADAAAEVEATVGSEQNEAALANLAASLDQAFFEIKAYIEVLIAARDR